MAYTADEWWKTDKDGRRIGWMWPEDFTAILQAHYNMKTKWIVTFAKDFGISAATVRRYRDGDNPIPKQVARHVQMLDMIRANRSELPELQAEWLPVCNGANARAPVEPGY